MLHVQTANGRQFSIDLGDVNAVDFDAGVLSFHTDKRTFDLGGQAWGGPVDADDAFALIGEWRAHRKALAIQSG